MWLHDVKDGLALHDAYCTNCDENKYTDYKMCLEMCCFSIKMLEGFYDD